MFRCRNSLFPAFIITRQWCHYSHKKQQRKYAAVIIGHYFFSCYTQLYYKVQEAWTNGLLCYLFRQGYIQLFIYVHLNQPLVLWISLRKSLLSWQMNYDCYLPCHSTLGHNEQFLFSITLTVIMSFDFIYIPLFIFNVLFSFQEINSTSDTVTTLWL